jgi:hypothetical protein
LRSAALAIRPAQRGTPPPAHALPSSLAEYESSAAFVRGFDRADWIYLATVIERAGIMLTAVFQRPFETVPGQPQHHLRFPMGPG